MCEWPADRQRVVHAEMPTPTPSTAKPDRRFIMKPYHSDPQSPSRRRGRRWLTFWVALFCLFYGLVYAFVTPFLLPVMAMPVAVLAMGVVWALPDLQSPPMRSMVGFYFATLVALVIWPNYLALALPGLPWITLLRVTGFPFALLLAICASTSAEFRQRTLLAMKAAPLTSGLLLAFVAIQFLSIALSDSKAESIQKFVVYQIYWTCIFFASCYIFLKPGRADRWAGILWVMAIPIALMALAEHHLRRVLWAGHIPGFLKIEDPIVQEILSGYTRRYTNIYRSQATFSTPLGLAEYLSLTIPFVIHYFLVSKRLLVRIAAGLTAPFLLFAIVISGSRLGLVGFGVSILMYGLVWALLRWRRNPSDILAPAIVGAYPLVMGAVVAASFLIGRIRTQVWGGGAQQASTEARIIQWKMGIPKILSHPFGHGVGRGAEDLGYYIPGGQLTIDSYYLLILMEYGIIGFAIYYGMLGVSVYYSTRWAIKLPPWETELALLAPLGISITSFFVMKAVFSNQDNHMLVFMMMGMICALIYRARQSLNSDRTAPNRRGHT